MLIRAGDRRIYYDLVGPDTGPMVCLLHSLSSDSGVWAEQLPSLLAAGWRVLRLDMRGHGGSDPVSGDYAMSELADDVVLVLDALGIDKVHLVGLSIGGMIAQTFAVERGSRLESLMLCGTSSTAVPGGNQMWEARFAAIERANAVEPLADDTMDRWFTRAFKPRRPQRWRQIRSTIASTRPVGYVAGARAIIRFDVRSQLPSVKTRTLVVCGDDDPGTPAEGNRLIASLIPGAQYREIASARHIPMVEHPELFSRILLDWLSSNARS